MAVISEKPAPTDIHGAEYLVAELNGSWRVSIKVPKAFEKLYTMVVELMKELGKLSSAPSYSYAGGRPGGNLVIEINGFQSKEEANKTAFAIQKTVVRSGLFEFISRK